jgi:flavin-dependent dehydrogenase
LPQGVALSREAFDAALVRAAIDAGVAFLPQTRAESPKGRTLVDVALRRGEEIARVEARVVLAADGLGGSFLPPATPVPGSRIGLGAVTAAVPAYFQPGTVYMACGRHGYLGLVRLEDGRLDLAAALDAAWVRAAGGPGAAAVQMLGSARWPAPADLQQLPWRGTRALTRQTRRVASKRVFAIGDATGYVEPFTGEGMAWSLAAAAAVAPLAERATNRWQPSMQREWTRTHRQVVRRRQLTCHLAAAVLRRPWLTNTVVALLANWPRIARPIVYYLNRRTTTLIPAARTHNIRRGVNNGSI